MESHDFQSLICLFPLCYLVFCVSVLSFSSIKLAKFLFMATFRSLEIAILYKKVIFLSDVCHRTDTIYLRDVFERTGLVLSPTKSASKHISYNSFELISLAGMLTLVRKSQPSPII